MHDVEEVRRGRLSEEERALERDYNAEGRASGDDRDGDDRWLPRHSPPQDLQVLSHCLSKQCRALNAAERDLTAWLLRHPQPEAWQALYRAVGRGEHHRLVNTG